MKVNENSEVEREDVSVIPRRCKRILRLDASTNKRAKEVLKETDIR